MQVYKGKSGTVREQKQGLWAVRDMACRMYGTRRDVTTDNFFTSCELAKSLLSKNMTVVGTLSKNTHEIPALFVSGVDVLDKLVREYTCTRTTRCWTLRLVL